MYQNRNRQTSLTETTFSFVEVLALLGGGEKVNALVTGCSLRHLGVIGRKAIEW